VFVCACACTTRVLRKRKAVYIHVYIHVYNWCVTNIHTTRMIAASEAAAKQLSGCEKRANSVDDANPVLCKRKPSISDIQAKQALKAAKKSAALDDKKAFSFESEPPQLPAEREVGFVSV
jgi:hypothetical protein